MRTLANGEVCQAGNTYEMLWDMHYPVADIARTVTPLPVDVLLSGTPAIGRSIRRDQIRVRRSAGPRARGSSTASRI